MTRSAPIRGLMVALALFLLDQLVKYLVTGPLGIRSAGDVRTIVPFFNLRFLANTGVSLGFLKAESDVMRWGLVVLTGTIATVVTLWMWRERNRVDQVALGFVLGGALGNIVDRVRLGYVIDYADLHFGEWRPFLVFNVADAAITVGVLVLLVRALLTREKPADAAQEKVNA